MESFVDDLVMEESQISGGQAHEGNVLWKRQPAELDEHRLLLTDTFVIEEESEEENIEDRLDRRRHQVHVCSRCGSVQPLRTTAQGAGLVHVSSHVILPMQEHKAARPAGFWCALHAKPGSDFAPSRRAFRPIKAIAVADVHSRPRDASGIR